ncbi:aromatic amino acid lyase [Streptomyces sp. RM72]|uniref:HAL/PAL/TAL family ammonia-lyase n=1 Tax=Streptomyces sp. RM72 TaxID=1115510 RepID=UPI001B399FF4|nr:aromatic amino acid ammonia-lyase [Streptomyces sp. RM72]MBQ0890179.1 aromatic amino acid lyase [Streptomyces sp. RM72]
MRTTPPAPQRELRLDGHSLTADDIHRISLSPQDTSPDLAEAAVLRMKRSSHLKEDLIASGIPVYGVTTGFGDSSNRQIGPEKTAALQRNLLRFLRVGTGPAAPPEVVRATMLIRANCAARGHSAIRPEPVRLILDMLRHDILPQIPERGSVGASGDLAPLSYLAAALIGEGVVTYRGERTPAAEALRAAGLRPVELQAKEGLALVNGTSFMSAYLALASAEAREIAWCAELCTAMAAEARRSSRDQFAAFPHLHKPHPGQITSAGNIRRFLDGSSLIGADADFRGDGVVDGDGYLELRRGIQDPYSIRCAPHVIGVLRDTLQWAEQWIGNEINSSNDNPLFDADAPTVHNSGNFYGGHVAQAASALTTAVAGVGDLLDRQLQLLVDPKFSVGLPANLTAAVEAHDAAAGLHHGFKGAQIAASALTAEALHLTLPVSSFSRSTEAHNQDKVSMGTIAARHTRTAVHLIGEVTAIHLLALCQAADILGADGLGPLTARAHRFVRRTVAFVREDRPLDEAFRQTAGALLDGSLRHEVMASARS